MHDFLISEWFRIGELGFTYGEVLLAMLYVIVCTSAYWLLVTRFLPGYFEKVEESEDQRRRVRKIISYVLYLSLATGVVFILELDFTLLPPNEHITIQFSAVLQALLILQLARLADWLISRIVVNRYYNKRDEPKETALPKKDTQSRAGRTVQLAVYLFATLLILTNLDIDWSMEFQTEAKGDGTFTLRLSNILAAILTLFIARLIAWMFTEIVLYSYYRKVALDMGSRYAFNQIAKYLIYLVAIIAAFQQLGINTTLLLGGLAALLVGIGLGLQQTFNDFFSGLLLLFERSVEVNDVLMVDDMIGKVRKIGIRASQIETRDNLTVVVPNSKLVSQNVINWSHEDPKARFWIVVPVPYGTEARVVKRILLDVARESPYVLEYPAPFIRLVEFADSSLNFELHFWSSSFMLIEDVKSDLRLQVNDRLLDEDIHIPFPQRDIWIKSKADS